MILEPTPQATIDAAEPAMEDEAGVSTGQSGADFCRFEAICDEAEPAPDATIDAAELAPKDEAGLTTDEPGADICRFEAICDEATPAPQTTITAAETASEDEVGLSPDQPDAEICRFEAICDELEAELDRDDPEFARLRKLNLEIEAIYGGQRRVDAAVAEPAVAEERFAEATDPKTADALLGNDVPRAEPTRVAGAESPAPEQPQAAVCSTPPPSCEAELGADLCRFEAISDDAAEVDDVTGFGPYADTLRDLRVFLRSTDFGARELDLARTESPLSRAVEEFERGQTEQSRLLDEFFGVDTSRPDPVRPPPAPDG